MSATIIKVKLLNADYTHGTRVVASGTSEFILYSAILFSLAFECICSTIKHHCNYV